MQLILEMNDMDEIEDMNGDIPTENIVIETGIVEGKKVKIRNRKSTVALECSKCNKIIKSQKAYDSHVLKQVCYDKTEITYCKVCNLTMPNVANYQQHLLSAEHFNNIGCNKIDVLNKHKQEPNKLLLADPYLSKQDTYVLGTTNMGDKYTFVFNNNTSQIVKLKYELTDNASSNIENGMDGDSVGGDNSISNVNSFIRNKEQIGTTIIVKVPNISPKQMKILGILDEKAQTVKDKCKLLYQLMDSNKLNMEDYKGLQNIIKYSVKDEKLLSAYVLTIEAFVKMLIKEKNNGSSKYKDKDIMTLVLFLTN